jgi:hypothetical protein
VVLKKEIFYLFKIILLLIIILFQFDCGGPTRLIRTSKSEYWLGIHVLMDSKDALNTLIGEIPDLAGNGVNLLITEIDYNFEFQSHPELRGNGHITREEIKSLLKVCRDYNVVLVPEFQCVGHQSWEKETFPLLKNYPQFDETPGQFPDNEGIYCRSWCTLNPDVNSVIFDLFNELVDAFEAPAFHVGMDEVFLIASDYCPRCKGKNPAVLFAKAVNDFYKYFYEHNVEMMMWGDRLIDTSSTQFSMWEASANNTQAAIDMISKNIIICDWHYGNQTEYLSIPIFLQKGFRVLPASWKDSSAFVSMINYSLKFNSENLLGHLCTTWSRPVNNELLQFPNIKFAAKKLHRDIFVKKKIAQ